MITLDDSTLDRWGLAELPPEDRRALLEHFTNDLERAVRIRLAHRMTDDQFRAFQELVEAGDSDRARRLLALAAPDYPDVVRATHAQLAQRVVAAAPAILAACGVPSGGAARHDGVRREVRGAAGVDVSGSGVPAVGYVR